MALDGVDLGFADERLRETGERGVTFSEGAHARGFAIADLLPDQFEASPGSEKIGYKALGIGVNLRIRVNSKSPW